MIGWLFDELVMRVAGDAVLAIGRGLGALVFSPRRAPSSASSASSGRRRPRPVIVSAAEMSARARDYEAWAETRGLELLWQGRADAHGAHFQGTRRGRHVALTTGIVDGGPPKSPELLVWTNAIATEVAVLLAHDEWPEQPARAVSWARELAVVLDVEGVRDIGVTKRFVRLRFDAFVQPKVLANGWDALEAALATIDAETHREAPYR